MTDMVQAFLLGSGFLLLLNLGNIIGAISSALHHQSRRWYKLDAFPSRVLDFLYLSLEQFPT